MTSLSRSLIAALALVGLGMGTAAAQQTLTFTNTDTNASTPGNQNQSVTLLAGSALAIAPDGNVSAECALTGGLCTGTGGGDIEPAPTVTLVASNFSQQPVNNLYPPGTTFTLTPTVTNAEICVRSVLGSTPSGTNWPATIGAPPFAAQTVAMLTGSSTYQFSMRCYGPGGATTFTLPNLATAAGTAPDGCTGFQTNLPAGWSRGPLTEFVLVPARVQGSFWNPFPSTGQLGYVITNANQYQSIAFTTPATDWTTVVPNRQVFWETAQQFGEADLAKTYVAITSCAGDFRVPPNNDPAPTNDPTFARGCRSLRPFGSALINWNTVNYEVSTLPSTNSICRLAPGRTYHLSFIRAVASDGSIGTPAEEAACENSMLSACGVQMRTW
ncbi:MAG: hypothetical protein LW860_19545 [Xanthomonadaceae bacterium]|jgi:hypothetical protein|nr:hypothetical protein [Xanthomonadaceae bacterium]